jgi:hypothetical protein
MPIQWHVPHRPPDESLLETLLILAAVGRTSKNGRERRASHFGGRIDTAMGRLRRSDAQPFGKAGQVERRAVVDGGAYGPPHPGPLLMADATSLAGTTRALNLQGPFPDRAAHVNSQHGETPESKPTLTMVRRHE